ncbi:MAG: hypothetical protein AB8G22_10140 [Saprospiraceae bacterium]
MNELNPKNYLAELIKEWGYPDQFVKYKTYAADESTFVSQVHLPFNNGLEPRATGTAPRKKDAEKAAAAALFAVIKKDFPQLLIDWQEIFIEAQAGDALVKLAAYVSPQLNTPEKKSNWLQLHETDLRFETIFDELYNRRDPRVSFFGKNLGKKRKATFIEALIWRTYQKMLIGEKQREILAAIFSFKAFE